VSEFLDDESSESGQGLPAFLFDPLGVIQRRWSWMLCGFFVGFAATVALVASQKPTYEASAKVLIKRQRIPESLVRSTVEEDTFEVINGLVSEVLSREPLAKLIRDQALYPELIDKMPLDEVIQIFRKHITVKPEQGLKMAGRDEARVVAISFEDTDRKKTASVANAIARAITEKSLENRSQQARVTTEFLRRELKRVEHDLQAQDSMIASFQERYRGELPDELETNLRRLERLQDQRHSLAIQISDAESRLASLMVSVETEQLQSGPSPTTRLAQLKAELAEAESMYTDKHPTVIALRKQVAALEKETKGSEEDPNSPTVDRSLLVKATKGQIDVLRKQLQEVEQELKVLDGRVARTPSREEELSALEQKKSVLDENYKDALRKVQEAELAESLELAQQGARLSIVDPARPPIKTSGKRLKYGLAGLIASLGIAAIAGFLLELIDPVVLSSEQIERFSGNTSLGSIPSI